MTNRRFTVFARPDSAGRPVWEVFDKNVRCDPRSFSSQAEAQAEADRREAA